MNKSINIAYIGGGSMNFGWRLIGELCQEEQLSGTIRLFDLDKKLSLANEVIGNKTREQDESKTGLIFIAVDTIEEALRDADFVILSISQGDISEITSDIHLPELYGLYQAIGDNTGPGGIIRAIRTIPTYINFAEEIKRLCPKAWVISMTEPMSACLKSLYKVFPEIKAFGCSNEVFSAQELLSDFVQDTNNDTQISRRDIKTSIIGINKFTWINEAMLNGDNLFDIYAENAKKYAGEGYEKKKLDFKNNPFASAHKVKFDLFLRYGLIAAASDRYLVDSCPPWYISNPKAAQYWKFGIISPTYIKRHKADKFARCKRLINGEETLRIGWAGNDCVAQIKAILGLCNVITNVVTINQGQISNLPIGSVVETNALFSINSVKPVFAGAIPEDIGVLINRQVANTNMLVDAIFSKDLDYAFNVFLNDPLMTLDLLRATELYKQMLSVNKAHLLYYC